MAVGEIDADPKCTLLEGIAAESGCVCRLVWCMPPGVGARSDGDGSSQATGESLAGNMPWDKARGILREPVAEGEWEMVAAAKAKRADCGA